MLPLATYSITILSSSYYHSFLGLSPQFSFYADEALRRAVEVAQQAAAAPLFDSFVRKDNGMWVHPGLSLDGSFKEVSYVMLNQTAMQQVEVAPLPKELAAGKGSSALKVDIAELFNKLLTLGGLHLVRSIPSRHQTCIYLLTPSDENVSFLYFVFVCVYRLSSGDY